MKVITFLNEKGGVGKTTLANHIAAGLAINGLRVVLIDADAQDANGSSQMRIKGRGFYALLVQGEEWRDCLQTPPDAAWNAGDAKGTLAILPSNIETRTIPMNVSDVFELKERLTELEGHIDVVIIDTSPTPSLLHSMIYLASDYMVYPTQAEMPSLRGIGSSFIHMTKMNKTRAAVGLAETQLLGVQPMMYRGQTIAHQHGLGMIKKQFKTKAWLPISDRIVWAEAGYTQQTLFAYDPTHVATKEAWAVVEQVYEGIA